jgi:hypothetical protein
MIPLLYGNAMKLLRFYGLSNDFLILIPFLVLGCFLGFRYRFHPKIAISAGLATYFSLAVGVIVQAMVEELFFRRWAYLNNFPSKMIYQNHNLLPFEIIGLWIVAPIPLLLGALFAHGLHPVVLEDYDTPKEDHSH